MIIKSVKIVINEHKWWQINKFIRSVDGIDCSCTTIVITYECVIMCTQNYLFWLRRHTLTLGDIYVRNQIQLIIISRTQRKTISRSKYMAIKLILHNVLVYQKQWFSIGHINMIVGLLKNTQPMTFVSDKSFFDMLIETNSFNCDW